MSSSTATAHQWKSTESSGSRMPGMRPVALAADDRGVFYEGAFGRRAVDKSAPITLDSVFRIASMTKAVTGAAVMQLVEQGLIGLDQPIGRCIAGGQWRCWKGSMPAAPRGFAIREGRSRWCTTRSVAWAGGRLSPCRYLRRRRRTGRRHRMAAVKAPNHSDPPSRRMRVTPIKRLVPITANMAPRILYKVHVDPRRAGSST
jgi:Beta-lactamase